MIQLTQEQYDNLDLLDTELKKKHPTFKGFNGSKENMEILGLDEAIAQQEIDKLDIAQLKIDNPEPKTVEERVAALEQKAGIKI